MGRKCGSDGIEARSKPGSTVHAQLFRYANVHAGFPERGMETVWICQLHLQPDLQSSRGWKLGKRDTFNICEFREALGPHNVVWSTVVTALEHSRTT